MGKAAKVPSWSLGLLTASRSSRNPHHSPFGSGQSAQAAGTPNWNRSCSALSGDVLLLASSAAIPTRWQPASASQLSWPSNASINGKVSKKPVGGWAGGRAGERAGQKAAATRVAV